MTQDAPQKTVGFKLREGADFEGGSFALPDGDTYDVAAALDATGLIVVNESDEVLINLLSAYPVLKRTTDRPALPASAKTTSKGN